MKLHLSTPIFLLALLQSAGAFAATEQVLWNFNPEAAGPGFPYYNSLVRDTAGNFYGVTAEGGLNGSGVVFRLSPGLNGGWSKSVLYSFGKLPNNELIGGLVLDKANNLYGVSAGGGAHQTGYVYQLSPGPGDSWTETVLHSFGPCCQGGADGATPFAGLAIAPNGNLFGTTSSGGSANLGTVYKLSRNSSGDWNEAILHSFTNYNEEGGYPESNLLIGSDGSLYGTAAQGGLITGSCSVGCGTVYKLAPSPAAWTFTVLHYFNSADGQYPRYAGVTTDSAGNLYGATEGGGANNAGTVWELTFSPGQKTYVEHILHSFGSGTADGTGPLSGVIIDAYGSVFGATPQAGLYGFGNVFMLSRQADGFWEESVLYNFMGDNDGGYPTGGVVLQSSTGNLLGMTSGGGVFGNGVLYEVTHEPAAY